MTAPTMTVDGVERIVFCGVEQERTRRETSDGKEYHICKWACPTCGKACSMLELDDEWCHGDSMSIRYKGGKRSIHCGACWLLPAATTSSPDEPVSVQDELVAALRLYLSAGTGNSTDYHTQGVAHGKALAAITRAESK